LSNIERVVEILSPRSITLAIQRTVEVRCKLTNVSGVESKALSKIFFYTKATCKSGLDLTHQRISVIFHAKKILFRRSLSLHKADNKS